VRDARCRTTLTQGRSSRRADPLSREAGVDSGLAAAGKEEVIERQTRMCGIGRAIASRNVVPILIEGLKRLEYRGYDSAGSRSSTEWRRDRGRPYAVALDRARRRAGEARRFAWPRRGHRDRAYALGTHGVPSEKKPIRTFSDGVSVVHNGSSRTTKEMRKRLRAKGYEFCPIRYRGHRPPVHSNLQGGARRCSMP